MQSGGSSPPILRKVNVNVYSNTECESAYQNAGYGVTNNMICAAVSGGMSFLFDHYATFPFISYY